MALGGRGSVRQPPPSAGAVVRHGSSGVTIRRAGPADADLVMALATEFATVDGHEIDPEAYRSALLPLLAGDDRGQVWVIGDGIGFAVVTWGWSLESGGRDALLDELYVRTRGAGVGSEALAAIVDRAREAGASRVFLETESHNEAARRFYARAGFGVEDSVWMVRSLSEGPRG
jgi:ribosomal protein S18 acetylase RimI-like enzyme